MTRLPALAIFGIPLRTSWAWIAVALAMTVISLTQLAPTGSAVPIWLAWASIVGLGAVGSILAHDYGHVVAARRLGTSFVSIEPSVVGALPDTCYPPESPDREVRVALAGPAVSLGLAALFGLGWLVAGSPRDLPGSAIGIIAAFNAGMVALGLLPGYPFDGGRVFRAFLWYLTGDLVRATRITSIYGHVLLFLTLLGGVILLSAGNEASVWGTWVLILCWTINRARSEGFSQILWSEAGKSLQIDDLFQAGVNRVNAASTIDECIESLLDNFRRGPTLVLRDQDVVGIVELASVRRVPRANWTQVPVGEIMTPVEHIPRLEYTAPVSELLAALPGGARNVVLIERNGSIIAAADRDFVMDRVESYIRAQHFARRRRRP